MNKFISILIPKSSGELENKSGAEYYENDKARKKRLFLRLALGSMLIITTMLLINCFVLPQYVQRWIITICIFDLSGLIVLLLNRKGYTRFASFILVSIIIAQILGLAWSAGGIKAPAMQTIPIVVVMTGLILGRKQGLLIGLIVSLGSLLLVLAEVRGILPTSSVQHNPFSLWISSVMTISMLALLQYLSVASLDNALKNAQHELFLRKRSEHELRASEAFRTRVFESSRVPIVVIDAITFKYLDCNQAAVDIYHYFSKEDVLGKVPMQFSAPIQYDGVLSGEKAEYYINKAMTDGSVVFEWKHQRPDGECWDAEVHLMSFEVDNKQLLQFTLIDITERKQAENALLESSIRYQTLVENSPDIIARFDKNVRYLFINSAVTQVSPLKPNDFIGKTMIEVGFTKEQADQRECMVQKIINGGVPFESELEFTGINGHQVYEWRGYPEFDSFGNVQSVLTINRNITERKKAEMALRENEEKYSRIVNTANEGIIVVDKNIVITYVNAQIAEMLGYHQEELLNQTFESFLFKEEISDHKNRMENRIRGISEKYERRFFKKDGTVVWLTVSASPIIDKENIFQGSFAMLIDSTERKKYEVELAESQAQLSAIFENTPDLICSMNAEDFSVLTFNRAIYDYFQTRGIKLRKGMLLEELFEGDWLVMWQGYYNRALKNGSFSVDYGTIAGDRVLEMSFNVMKFDEKIFGISVFARDITKQKITEHALRENEERLKKLVNSVTDYIYTVKIENGIAIETTHGEGCISVTGYSTNEFKNDSYLWFNIVHDDDKNIVRHHAEITILNNSSSLEHRIIHKDGSIRWVRNTPVTIYNTEGIMIGYDGLIVDITERKIVEEKLKQNEHLLKRIVESTQNVIYIFAIPEFKNIFINRNIWTMLGYENEQIETISFLILKKYIHPDDIQVINDHYNFFKNANENDIIEFEYRIKKANGQWIWLKHSEVIFNKSDDGKSIQILGTAIDISEHKETERRILNASIDAEERERNYFARELHDGIGPLLSTIKLYFQWLNKPELQTPKEEILANAEKTIQETIFAVKEISHKLSPHVLTNFGLTFAIKSFTDKLKETATTNIVLESNIEQRLEKDIEVTLFRVIIECVNNTLKYANANNILIKLSKSENLVTIEYTDDGIGFNYEETMKSGKGLGLFNMQNRISVLGGSFVIDTMKDKGLKIKAAIRL